MPFKCHLRAQNLKQGRKEELSGCFGACSGAVELPEEEQGVPHPAAAGAGPGAPRIARGRRRRASRTPQNVSVCLKVAFLCFKIFLFLCVCVSKPSRMSENSCPSHFAVEQGADSEAGHDGPGLHVPHARRQNNSFIKPHYSSSIKLWWAGCWLIDAHISPKP